MKRKNVFPALMAAAGLVAAGGLAYAQQGPFAPENDAVTSLGGVRVSLVQAITSAEQHVAGRASRAVLESRNGASVFDVEVVTAANVVMDVKVDADGKILSAVQDQPDEQERSDEHDEEGGADHKD